jgi:hypothetical protein
MSVHKFLSGTGDFIFRSFFELVHIGANIFHHFFFHQAVPRNKLGAGYTGIGLDESRVNCLSFSLHHTLPDTHCQYFLEKQEKDLFAVKLSCPTDGGCELNRGFSPKLKISM